MRGDLELTGNDYVSLPQIGTDGSIAGVTVVHGGLAGLIEWAGGPEPLLRLRLVVDGRDVPLDDASWRRLDRWIPVFSLHAGDISVTGTVCAPAGYPYTRGFFVRVELDNRGRRRTDVQLHLDVVWDAARLWIASARPLPGRYTMSSGDGRVLLDTEHAALVVAAADAEVAQQDDRRATLSRTATLRANERSSMTFVAGAGRERDAAHAAVDGLLRYTPEHWLRQTRLELSHTIRSAEDHRWAETLNRNLLFNRYYSVGRGIDDDLLYVMRSRSPLCPRPAVLNEREALLYSLPALIHADTGIARETLFRVVDIASERSGEHLRYIDGGALDAAFVLDQMLLYPWAIGYFAINAGDESVSSEPFVSAIMHETDSTAFARLHPEHMLAFSELLPSGEPSDFPYPTMANALLWRFAESVANEVVTPDEPPVRFAGTAAEINAAIWQQCVTDMDGHVVLVSSVSLGGQAAVYDDPSLSLALLPFFGMCTPDDPVWMTTMEFLRSPRYPLWRAGAVPGLADRNDPQHARTSALCADLFAGIAQPLERLLKLQLPSGVAAGCYDTDTGECAEPHDAALAGFLAWTLIRAAESARAPAGRRSRRR